MKNRSVCVPLVGITMALVAAMLACSLPGYTPADPAAQYQATVQAAAAQTVAAQDGATPNIAATIEALAQANNATATAAARSGGSAATQAAATQSIASTQAAAQATGAAFASHATAAALSGQATAQAGSAVQATAIAQAAQATARSWSATATALSVPPPPPPFAGRIRFAPGATSANIDGNLARGASADYLIEAGAQQTMLASVYSPNNDVYLGVAASNGVPLLRPNAGQTSFSGQLPNNGDYRLTVTAPQSSSSYTLQVIIPARIQFAPGAVSARVPGYLAGGQVNYYLAWARGGQRMSINIISPNNDVFLTVYGLQDGSPLVRSVMGLSSWSDVLNLSQDYMIQAVSTGGSTNYTLEITIQ